MRAAAVALLLAVACTTTEHPVASPPSLSPTPVPPSTPPASPSPVLTSLPASFGGASVPWPRTTESSPAPPALGAVVTLRRTRASNGETLAAGLTLPRVGGTVIAPQVLTPCGRAVVLAGRDVRRIAPGSGGALPKRAGDVVVLVDPGHGGPQLGAVSPDGDREKDRNLAIALQVRSALAGRVGRVVMTRERDFEATIGFRAALADALRVDAALSVHLNSSPDSARTTPGTETFGETADAAGRRFAGLVYESVRRYVQTLPGPWVGDRDAGAKYRIGRDGKDYYGLLRRSHRPFVISESMYMSSAHEAALVARPDVRASLGKALADAVVAFTVDSGSGSGWTVPYPRPPDPSVSDTHTCHDPG